MSECQVRVVGVLAHTRTPAWLTALMGPVATLNTCVYVVVAEKRGRNAGEEKRVSKGGRPLTFGAAAYRNRYVVERSFACVKQWRGPATRYDKLAITDRAAIVISAILT